MDLNVLKALGTTYFELSDYPKAIEYYTQCLEYGGPSRVILSSHSDIQA